MTTDRNDPPITAIFALAYLNAVFQNASVRYSGWATAAPYNVQ